MSSAALETFLARLYVEPVLREKFLRDPRAACADAQLTTEEATALAAIDHDGLALAASSFARKRASRRGSGVARRTYLSAVARVLYEIRNVVDRSRRRDE